MKNNFKKILLVIIKLIMLFGVIPVIISDSIYIRSLFMILVIVSIFIFDMFNYGKIKIYKS